MLRWTTQLVPPEYLGSHIVSATARTRPGAGTTCPSAPGPRCSVTSASSGTSPPSTRPTPRRARRVGRVLQGAPRSSCSAATSCGWTPATRTSWSTASSPRPVGSRVRHRHRGQPGALTRAAGAVHAGSTRRRYRVRPSWSASLHRGWWRPPGGANPRVSRRDRMTRCDRAAPCSVGRGTGRHAHGRGAGARRGDAAPRGPGPGRPLPRHRRGLSWPGSVTHSRPWPRIPADLTPGIHRVHVRAAPRDLHDPAPRRVAPRRAGRVHVGCRRARRPGDLEPRQREGGAGAGRPAGGPEPGRRTAVDHARGHDPGARGRGSASGTRSSGMPCATACPRPNPQRVVVVLDVDRVLGGSWPDPLPPSPYATT